jgi:hypothetical protein
MIEILLGQRRGDKPARLPHWKSELFWLEKNSKTILAARTVSTPPGVVAGAKIDFSRFVFS